MAKNTFIGTGGSDSWTNTGNWSQGSAPVSTQDLYLTANTNPIATSLDAHTVLPASFNVYSDFTGSVGTSGTATTAYLQLGPTVANVGITGQGSGQGPRRLNLNTGSTTTTINILNTTTSPLDPGQAPVRLLGTSMTVNLSGGIISIAAFPTETATVTSLNITNGGTGTKPQAYIGPGVTLTALTQSAGEVTSASTITVPSATVSRKGTSFTHTGTGGFGTLTIGGGAGVSYDGTGTVTNLFIDGTLDTSGGGGTITVTNSTVYANCNIIDPGGRLVFSNPPVLVNCSMKDITVDVGQGRKW